VRLEKKPVVNELKILNSELIDDYPDLTSKSSMEYKGYKTRFVFNVHDALFYYRRLTQ
jgi:hypothetical protein